MKFDPVKEVTAAEKSPPSRGAWIEIFMFLSVLAVIFSRPPRGGRGLK